MDNKKNQAKQPGFFNKYSTGDDDTERIKGIIERITFQNAENGYSVLKLNIPSRPNHLVTITGMFPTISVGETLEVEGKWILHPSYGQQFKSDSYHTVFPVTVGGIAKFLGSGLIKGVGPVTAKRIVDTFKEDTLEIIEKYPEKLNEVEGIGDKRIEIIAKGWSERKHVKDLMLFLASHNVSTTLAMKVYRHYGARAISVLQQDPYQLVYDISGIGFITADKIALDLGIPPSSQSRLKAGIHYVLISATEEGHVYYPNDELINQAAELLKVSEDEIRNAREGLIAERRIIVENENVYLYNLYFSESEIVKRILQILSHPVTPVEPDAMESEITALEERFGIKFADRQRDAVKKAFSSRILVLTGGPGTGKTTMVRGILSMLRRQNLRVALGAPTGRAAKRLEETTGCEAKTIHRLLEFNPRTGQFTRDEQNPLQCDVVIIDEVSMLDLTLFHNLMKGLSFGIRLILVGDVDQLPAVGPGNVLKDIINSGIVEVVRLDLIFRQSGGSDIVSNAHRINQGEFPHLSNNEDDNFFFVNEEDPEKIAETIMDLCARRIKEKYRLDPIMDVQVITPMYKGEAGAHNLNAALQGALNPKGREIVRGGRAFRIGDKVMQIRNNYQKEIFNGDIGRITYIDLEDQGVLVEYGGGKIHYEFSELDEIVLAYAITVHKSQGSEYKAVIMPVVTQHFVMLQRNLLYTAITRAKKLFIMVGTKKALNIAIKNNKIAARFTSLSSRLTNPALLSGK